MGLSLFYILLLSCCDPWNIFLVLLLLGPEGRMNSLSHNKKGYLSQDLQYGTYVSSRTGSNVFLLLFFFSLFE